MRGRIGWIAELVDEKGVRCLIQDEQHGDLRDLIARPYHSHDTVIVRPDEPLANAYKRMKLYDVSQLPVMEEDRIVGILDESDLLLGVMETHEHFDEKVESVMVRDLTFIQRDEPIRNLLPIFSQDYVAIVMDGDKFLGLITRLDLLNHLRRRADF